MACQASYILILIIDSDWYISIKLKMHLINTTDAVKAINPLNEAIYMQTKKKGNMIN